MEVHVGSVDEEEDEQGIAHMIEHVTFLGSKKREKLLGTGARSNAYTDFHHTVFHIHSSTYSKVLIKLSFFLLLLVMNTKMSLFFSNFLKCRV
jgi:predicted Zn-dependent peptidase